MKRGSGVLLLLALVVVAAHAQGGSSPVTGNRLGKMTFAEIRALAVTTGFPDPDTAAAIAMAESGGFPHVIGDAGSSFGLWQVNIPSHPGYSGDELIDPTKNALAAFRISKSGTDFAPWTTYRNGAYKKYMPAAPGAA